MQRQPLPQVWEAWTFQCLPCLRKQAVGTTVPVAKGEGRVGGQKVLVLEQPCRGWEVALHSR